MTDKVPWTAKKVHQILLLIEDKQTTDAERASICTVLPASVRELLESQYGLKAKIDVE